MTKNISISDEAYNILSMEKRENESFSIVIQRVMRKKKIKLSDFWGILSKKSGEALEENIMEARKKDEIMHKKRLKEMENMFS